MHRISSVEVSMLYKYFIETPGAVLETCSFKTVCRGHNCVCVCVCVCVGGEF
jgi:hypothetical protein